MMLVFSNNSDYSSCRGFYMCKKQSGNSRCGTKLDDCCWFSESNNVCVSHVLTRTGMYASVSYSDEMEY